MSSNLPKNLQASVRQRLLNKATLEKRPFNEVLQYYAIERFLYRLSKSPHANAFILKGALMLRVWESPELRATMDIDFLGKTTNEEGSILQQLKEIFSINVLPDGISFDPDSIKPERITEDANYEGIRVRFIATLDSAKISMQIDIGFGDAIFPAAEKSEFPTILDFPAPLLLCYSRESSIAEKFEAMIKLGELNSRMKDFYDIWLLSRLFDFERSKITSAVKLTFTTRGTAIPKEIPAFSDSFVNSKKKQWAAFHKRLKQDHVPEDFTEIIKQVRGFLQPIAKSLTGSSTADNMTWIAPGFWT